MNPPPTPPTAPAPVSIIFNLNRWDLLQCRLWGITQNRFLVGMILFFSIALPAINPPGPGKSPNPILFETFFFIIAFCGILGFMIALQIVVQIALLFSSQSLGVLGKQEIIIREDALVARSETSESIHLWKGFQKMRDAGGFIFLYVGGNIVHYIPRRCFPSPAAAADFKNQIKAHVSPKQNF
jgi:xanthosine utilization system XapX-like protein